MKKIPFALILIWAGHLYAQNMVSGVLSDIDGNPLAFANVLLINVKDLQLSEGTISDEQGSFSIESDQTGAFFLKITSLGFSNYSSQPFHLNGSTVLKLEAPIILKEDAQQLDEIELVGRKNVYERRTDRTVVNVQSSAIHAGGSALSAIETSPGMTVNRITGTIGMLGKDGTLVYINGKRVRMSGSALIQMLDGLSSSNIDKLELINSPPASFDADGTGGVVNIVLRQEETNRDWSGTISGNSGYGNNIKYGTNSDIHRTTEKFDFFISLGNSNNYNQQPTFVDKQYMLDGMRFEEDLNGARDAFIGSTQLRMGGTYRLHPKMEIGSEFKIRRNVWNLEALSETTETENGSNLYMEELVSSEINNWTHYLASFFVNQKFGESSLVGLEYDYLEYSNVNDASYNETRLENGLSFTRNFVSEARTEVEFHVARFDFKTVLNRKTKWAIGAKGTISKFANDVLVFDTSSGEPIRDDAFSENRMLDEDIWAGYTNLNFMLNEKTNAEIGLRYEYTDSNLSITGRDNAIILKGGQLFPTLNVSHAINEDWNTSLSYGERILRPDFSILSPAFYFFNSNTIYTGNPVIRPVTSRSLTWNLGHGNKQLAFQYTDEDNPNAWALSISEDFRITTINPQPMEDRKLFSTTLSFPLRVLQNLTSNNSVGIFWQHEVPIYNDVILTRNNWYINLNSSLQYQFSNKLTADLSINWISPRIMGLSDSRAAIGLNFGISHRFSKRWQLSFSFRDILDRNSFMEFDSTLPENNTNLDWFYQDEGNIGSVSLRYNFGAGRERKERRYGSQDEQNRLD